jgi:Membrane protein involved in the export of O-antigen and teichoic acid
MKQKIKWKRTGRGKRKEWMLGAGLIAYLIGLIIRIPLVHIIGDKGLGFFAAGMELLAVLSAVFSYGISKTVMLLVKYRAKRDMFKSAKKVYRSALFFTMAISILAAVFVFFFGEFIAQTFVLEYMGYLAVMAVAPAILLSGLLGVIRGYLQGMGAMTPTVHSKLLEKVIMLFACLMLAAERYNYGLKVAALLRNDDYAAAYGAMGAAIGVSIAGGVAVLHMVFIKLAYTGTFKQQLAKDTSKYVESNGQIISMFFSVALPYLLCALLYNMNYLVDQRIFNYAMNRQERGSIRVAHWGIYYGKYSVIIGIFAVACALAAVSGIPRIAQMYEKQEYGEAKYRIESKVHHLVILSIPCAVWTAVLAEPMVGMLFTGDQDTAAKLLRTGSSVIVVFAFSYFFMSLLQRIRKIRIVILGGLAAFVVHLIFLLALINSTKLGIVAVALGLLVFWLVACIAGFIGVMQSVRFSVDWIRTLGVTAIAAGASGLLGLFLSKLLIGLIGNAATFILCFVLCIIVYLVVLIALKGVREDELEDIPGGNAIVVLAERMHLM